MNRPEVICHMTMSIDGKVSGAFLGMPQCERAGAIDELSLVPDAEGRI